MKLIYKPRMAGKTTELIKLAAKGKYKLIVVGNRHMVDWTWRKILEMEKNKEIEGHPPQPITYEEFMQDRKTAGRNIESVLIDNVDVFLQWLTPINVEAVTFNKTETDNPFLEAKTDEIKNPISTPDFQKLVMGDWIDEEKPKKMKLRIK